MKSPSGSTAALLAFTLYGLGLHAQAVNPPVEDDSEDRSSVTRTVEAPVAPGAPSPGSQVRIVRLSEVKGEVQLDRNTDRGFEAAFANLPITQGAKLRTAEGVAEVEFEDNSTLRMTPNTVVEFRKLGRNPAGSTASNVNVVKGTVYVSLANTKGNEFTVNFGDAEATLPPSSHIQLYVGTPTTRLGVYQGTVPVKDVSGITNVGKKKALLFDSASHAAPTMVSSLEKSPYDSWDKSSVDYHKSFKNASAYGNSAPLYGLSDLNYYGSFINDASCGGSMWRPYLASAAWDPFANGAYAWYPGAGYSWVSPYPWGWTPFHSGEWQYCPSRGWGWRPGGNWTGLNNTATLRGPNLPVRPRIPLAPLPGHSTIVPVNTRPLAYSKLASADTFVFHKDSAGLGVPRQSLGKLGRVSSEVAQHGSASATISDRTGAIASQAGRGPNVTNGATNIPGSNQSNQSGHSTASSHSSAGANSSTGMSQRSPVGGSSPAGSSGSHR